jgi:hypothetical protein
MVSREQIERALRELNAAENNRPNTSVEETSARIDAIMAPDVSGWKANAFFPNRAAERDSEHAGFSALPDYHRDIHVMIIDPPFACIRWTIKGTAKGKPVVAPGASIFEFNDDGLICRYWMHIDPADFAYRKA